MDFFAESLEVCLMSVDAERESVQFFVQYEIYIQSNTDSDWLRQSEYGLPNMETFLKLKLSRKVMDTRHWLHAKKLLLFTEY